MTTCLPNSGLLVGTRTSRGVIKGGEPRTAVTCGSGRPMPVVVRFSRHPDQPPYGLIEDEVS